MESDISKKYVDDRFMHWINQYEDMFISLNKRLDDLTKMYISLNKRLSKLEIDQDSNTELKSLLGGRV